jgi:hypothetical protein
MARNKKWSEMSPGQKSGVVTLSLVELLLTAVALRDLARRPGNAVRGPKWVWSVLCFIQPVGPILYLALGRRRGTAGTAELLAAD